MFIRKYTCQGCGAAAEARAEGAYVYCASCGACVGLDFAYSQRRGYTKENVERQKRHTELTAGFYERKQALQAAGDRSGYEAIVRKEAEISAEIFPDFVYRAALAPGPVRDAYLEYQVKTTVESAFNPKIVKAQADLIASFPPGVIAMEMKDGKMVYHADGKALIAYVKRSQEAQRVSLAVYREQGLTELLPEELSEDTHVKQHASVMLQAYSPYMDPESTMEYIEAFGLKDSCHWTPEEEVSALCARCGTPLGPEDEEGQIECPSCGHRIVNGAFPFTCAGCGAPLAIEPDEDFVQCPYCSTLGGIGTYDPFSYIQALQEELEEGKDEGTEG